jgi:hypothetical protein
MAKQPQRLSADLLGVPKGEAGADTPEPEREDQSGMPTPTVALTVRVSLDVHEKLRERSFRKRRPIAVMLREALDRYLASP